MDKRYQVFVSSTFKDLEDERQEVMHALLELDCMPSGMELFPATNDTQWNLIKKVIDDCDYYILIIGGRYGSTSEQGVSYTEMEYRYALETGKPTIAFLHKNPGSIVADKTEASTEGKAKLATFRALAEKKLCKHWTSATELGSVVSRSLIQLMKSTPATGWIRGSELAGPEVMAELIQLRKKVDEAKNELERARTTGPKGAEGLSKGDDAYGYKYTFKVWDRDTAFDKTTYAGTGTLTWNEIFAKVAPVLIHEATDAPIKESLDALVTAKERPEQRLDFGKRAVGNFSLSIDDFQTIKVQLRALGLIAKVEKARSVRDTEKYWTLTPYGDEVMTQLRAIRAGGSTEPEADDEDL